DPSHGILEAQTPHFSLTDADCGTAGTVVGKQPAEPGSDSSAVFNFYLKPQGEERSVVTIQAVYATPVRVPFHPLANVECVSRGTQEAALLKQIEEEASLTHRPPVKKPAEKATD